MVAVITIATRSHLHCARALMQSVATVLPEAERHVLIVDAEEGFDPKSEDFAITLASELGLAAFEELAFVNEATGLCCVLKPAFARHVLRHSRATDVIYADSDILFYAKPEALLEALAHSPVVLTPHALQPLGDRGARTDVDMMRAGAFNAGFFAVRRSERALMFLDWWLGGMCLECRLDRELLDQLWLNLAIVYFPWITAFRHPGYNVAYWNIHQRPVARNAAGTLTADGWPLVVFHFSFFRRQTPELLAHRGPLSVRAPTELVAELLRDYAARLEATGAAQGERMAYRYGRFTDDKLITAEHRTYYLDRVRRDTDHRGSLFSPRFETRNYRGLKRVHAVDHWLTRSLRAIRRAILPPPS